MNSIFAMGGTKIYKPTDKMSDLICENYALLQVLSRFGVPWASVTSRYRKYAA